MKCRGYSAVFGCHWCGFSHADPKKTWVVWCWDCVTAGLTACEDCYRRLCGEPEPEDPEPPQ